MPDAYAVNCVKKAFCERQIMDRIQDVCLANSVISYKTVYFGRELHCARFIILEIS